MRVVVVLVCWLCACRLCTCAHVCKGCICDVLRVLQANLCCPEGAASILLVASLSQYNPLLPLPNGPAAYLLRSSYLPALSSCANRLSLSSLPLSL